MPILKNGPMNYSECFSGREFVHKQHGITFDEAQGYRSYANGGRATSRPENYVDDPYKILLANARAEMGHVLHMRFFDTRQPDLATVPGRTRKPAAVNSVGLIGKVIEGKTASSGCSGPRPPPRASVSAPSSRCSELVRTLPSPTFSARAAAP